MNRFKPGQKVVCTSRNWWRLDDGKKSVGPKYNEIVTVGPYRSIGTGFERDAFLIEAFGQWYHDANFEPIISDEVLHAQLDNILTMERA